MSAVLLPNPAVPANEVLASIFYLNNGADNTAQGLRAVWRHGCDAGMVSVSATSSDAGSHL